MKNFFKSIIAKILQLEAKAVLKKYKPKIVAITGSVGKTTTKDAIYTVLAEAHFVRKSMKSFNSEIGLPLTILGKPNAWSNIFLWIKNIFEGLAVVFLPQKYPETLVLEVGADRPGDIKRVGEWLRPDITVITRLGEVPVHVEYFSSPAALKKEKSYLAAATKPDGFIILNADDEDVMTFADLTDAKVLTYGFSERADVRASEYAIAYETEKPVGVKYKITFENKSVEAVISGTLGRQHVYSTLAAAAVGVASNMSLEKIAEALRSHETPPGRMKIIDGIYGSVIIDDTYNSSPVAAHEALETLHDISVGSNGRKIAVLGDMLELGEFSPKEHRALGEKTAQSFANVPAVLVTIGLRAKTIAESAKAASFSSEQIFSFDDSVVAGEFLKGEIKAGDVVLCKGSQGMRVEKAVIQILKNPEDAPELLVRQESEWQNR
ncbi:MAG: UDP-N-acetylmuramoyl-tripeptide--D-alanyl-D-alanine ligase [Patescibacteria group bacterium]